MVGKNMGRMVCVLYEEELLNKLVRSVVMWGNCLCGEEKGVLIMQKSWLLWLSVCLFNERSMYVVHAVVSLSLSSPSAFSSSRSESNSSSMSIHDQSDEPNLVGCRFISVFCKQDQIDISKDDGLFLLSQLHLSGDDVDSVEADLELLKQSISSKRSASARSTRPHPSAAFATTQELSFFTNLFLHLQISCISILSKVSRSHAASKITSAVSR
jgi:hypothetical protein